MEDERTPMRNEEQKVMQEIYEALQKRIKASDLVGSLQELSEELKAIEEKNLLVFERLEHLGQPAANTEEGKQAVTDDETPPVISSPQLNTTLVQQVNGEALVLAHFALANQQFLSKAEQRQQRDLLLYGDSEEH